MVLKLNPQKFKDYAEKDLAYKYQVRNIICEELGYEPPLNVSVLSELILRAAYRRHALGETSQEELESNIDFQVQFINTMMLENTTSYHC